ncbi:hypothetical protein EZS27_016928 [termite gut metagenome]|uniref:Uncharacterized protein n=1 Tax=termite gut metagenome TaxID=433724 RepID=A0A5J4RMK7_9ZZZZ
MKNITIFVITFGLLCTFVCAAQTVNTRISKTFFDGNTSIIDIRKILSPVLFAGDAHTAYRDPAVLFHEGVFYLFFSFIEIEPDGYIYSYVAYSKSRDLIHWTSVKKITQKDQSLNYSSPGNIIRYGKEWLICFQTYPRPRYHTSEQKIRYGDQTARIFLMRSHDLENWSNPELLKVKGDSIAVEDMGRMIDPYLIRDKDDPDKYWCFYKQNGVSLSYTCNFSSWNYFGHTEAGENACVLVRDKTSGIFLFLPYPLNQEQNRL